MYHRVKYPRTVHLPYSPGASKDDLRLSSDTCFFDQEVVIAEKMDGENTTMYRTGSHARSTTSTHHPSRSRVKVIQARIAQAIPEGWRVCGENVTAQHSVFYTDLEDWFLVFSIWNAQGTCLAWDETVEWCQLLSLCTVPVLFRGAYTAHKVEELAKQVTLRGGEGVVVRVAHGFPLCQFAASVAKWVHPNHVQTDEHWLHRPAVFNTVRPTP